MPVTGRLFWRFEDKGWIFSKVLAIAATGFLTWFLTAIRLIPFNALTCAAVTILCAVICFFLLRKESKKRQNVFQLTGISLIYWEELLFFLAFLMWTYLAGIPPCCIWNREVHGLWFYGSYDEKHHTSGKRSVVFRRTY